MRRALLGLSTIAALGACSGPAPVTPPQPPENRCEADLAALTSNVGKTARARKIESAQDLLTGAAARGRVGDFRLENDRVRLVVQAPDRHMQPNPFGGALVDATLAEDGAGDSFGKLAVFYALGRTQRATRVSVLRSGEYGGAAVVVADGVDALNDAVNLRTALAAWAPGRDLVVDPDMALPLTSSTYYVLNPGESRVRVVTAFCNDGDVGLDLPVGDLVDPGPGAEFFFPGSCTGGLGSGTSAECRVCAMSWFGFQGDGVAYGYGASRAGSSEPALHNDLLGVAGAFVSLLGATENRGAMDALLDWTDPNIKQRDGTLHVEAGGKGTLVRDLIVGRDLGEVATLVATYRNPELQLPMGGLEGTVKAAGQPVAGARVALEQDVGGKRIEQAVFVTDADGAWSGRFVAGAYFVSAWAPGSGSTETARVVVQASGTATHDFELTAPRTLTVEVRDLGGAPVPSRITVLCDGGACPTPRSSLARYLDVLRDPWPDDVAAVAFAGPSGAVDVALPPAKYRLVVSHGPGWTVFPTTWAPADAASGYAVDLTTADEKVLATLAKVVDLPGWVSLVQESDPARLAAALADGIDVVISTGRDEVLAFGNVPGEEISTFDYGHFSYWPLARDEADLMGGAVDWGGGEGMCLPEPELEDALRRKGDGTLVLEHPRGPEGVFTAAMLDTDTGASHVDPARYRLAAGSRLLSFDFDAMEILDGAFGHELLNDWFSFLSRGVLAAGVGGNGWRTYARTGAGDVGAQGLSAAVNGRRVFVTSGPSIQLAARAGGAEVGVGGTLAASSGFELVVDVQAPTWMSLERIEVYTHVAGGDVPCSQNPDPKASPKSRVACNGQPNANWPSEGIAASAALATADLVLEKVGEKDGIAYQRTRVTRAFAFPAPSADTWFVAAVHGSGSVFPLADGAAPFAVTNPVFVDADGGGYDKPPSGELD